MQIPGYPVFKMKSCDVKLILHIWFSESSIISLIMDKLWSLQILFFLFSEKSIYKLIMEKMDLYWFTHPCVGVTLNKNHHWAFNNCCSFVPQKKFIDQPTNTTGTGNHTIILGTPEQYQRTTIIGSSYDSSFVSLSSLTAVATCCNTAMVANRRWSYKALDVVWWTL